MNYYKEYNPAMLLITHYQRLLDYIKPTHVHIINDGKIVKTGDYSLVKEIGDFAQKLTDSVYSLFKRDILITDTDYVVAATGDVKKEILNTTISDDLLNIIKNRVIVVSKYGKLRINEQKAYDCSYVASPIICQGDSIGVVIIILQNEEINEIDEKIAQMSSYFLSKYLED